MARRGQRPARHQQRGRRGLLPHGIQPRRGGAGCPLFAGGLEPRRRCPAHVLQGAHRHGGGGPLCGGAGGEGDRLGGDGVTVHGGLCYLPAALGGGVPSEGGELLHIQGLLHSPGGSPGVRYLRLHLREGRAYLPQPAPQAGEGAGRGPRQRWGGERRWQGAGGAADRHGALFRPV